MPRVLVCLALVFRRGARQHKTTLTFHWLGLAGDLMLRAVQRDRITKIRPNLDNIAAASCARAKVR